jgi:hypothetical protein
MIVIGVVFIFGSIAMAVGHFGFGLPVHDETTGEQLTGAPVVLYSLAILSVGLLLSLTGRAILKAWSRHDRRQAARANGS